MGSDKEIIIEGNSGAELSIIRKTGAYYVRKKSTSQDDSHRLKIQAEKQRKFHQVLELEKIDVPFIESFNENQGDFFSFDM